MHVDVLTLFPGMFNGPLTESIIGRAQDEGHLDIKLHDLKEWGLGNYRQFDDEPYGGGAGMIMRVDVIVPAVESILEKDAKTPRLQDSKQDQSQKSEDQRPHRILLSARGERLTQEKVESLSKYDHLLLVCGHYEGVDQRVVEGGFVDEEISIGDYVLTGGELPAMVLIDAVARQIPGVLGKAESAQEESFSKALDRKKEYPHYTRPEEFRGFKVPDVLLSGHHAEIDKWREKQLS